MGLSFIFPAALSLLLLLPGLWLLAWLLPRRLAGWRFWSSLAARSVGGSPSVSSERSS